LMTYYIIRDFLKATNTSMAQKVTVDADFSSVPGDGSQIKLKKGDVLTIESLIESLLIVSANDSAIQLEKMVEDRTGKDFLKLMKNKSIELGLNKTNYINTSGLTVNNNGKKLCNTTTAYETAILAKKIVDDYPDTLKITDKKVYTYKDVVFNNTNKLLLKDKNIDGLKTGYTTEAGYCLASTIAITPRVKENKPFRLIGVTLGSKSDLIRTSTNAKVIKYGEENFENKKIVKKGYIHNIPSEYHKGGLIPSSVGEDVYYLLKNGSKIDLKVSINEGLTGKVKRGDKVGKLFINIDGSSLEEDLIAINDVKRVNIFKRMVLLFKNMF
ncbi:MAG: hypothetical protein RR515_02515, partial [Clostridium sp.]